MSREPSAYFWPDGQIREEPPYQCGAFRVADRAQCFLLSDHSGSHRFQTPNATPAPRGAPGDEDTARLDWLEDHRSGGDAANGYSFTTWNSRKKAEGPIPFVTLRELIDAARTAVARQTGGAVE